MLGVSLWTLRLYVARGALRATHVGRRVLIPMEVLEKVMVEGVKPKECVKKAAFVTEEWRGLRSC